MDQQKWQNNFRDRSSPKFRSFTNHNSSLEIFLLSTNFLKNFRQEIVWTLYDRTDYI